MEALLTPIEAAQVLGITSLRVTKLARDGLLPCVMLPNGEPRFDAGDLRQWIESLKQPQREGVSR